MSRVYEAIRTIARDEADRVRTSELGVVKAAYPRTSTADPAGDYACDVELRDSGLVLPRVAVAAGVMGGASIPVEGDLVVVVFIQGDLHAPVIVGRLYPSAVAPPEHGPGQAVLRLPPGSDDPAARVDVVAEAPSSRDRLLEIKLGGDPEVVVSVRSGEVSAQAGEARFAIRQGPGAAGEARLWVGDNELRMDGSGEVSLKSANTLTLQAATLELNGDVKVKINGQIVELN